MTIPKRLTSRKFWLTITTVIMLALNNQYEEAATVILAYLGIQGVDDAVSTYTSNKYTNTSESPNTTDDDDVDTSSVVSGEDNSY